MSLKILFQVRVNQRIHFLPNVCGFPLPARLQWLEPASGKRKSADVERKTYTLIYPDPSFSSLRKGATTMNTTTLGITEI